MERAVHDRGGWPTDAPIDRTEHELADWEILMDAIENALENGGVMNTDQMRRGIESMRPDEYERASYYERWLFSTEANLIEQGILAPGEIDERAAR
jgi:nitrile hydratase subunit beta